MRYRLESRDLDEQRMSSWWGPWGDLKDLAPRVRALSNPNGP